MKKTYSGDVELFRNYFLVTFKEVTTGSTVFFEMAEGERIDRAKLKRLVERNRIITFNGNNYDIPIIYLAISGASISKMRRASDMIINGGCKPWDIESEFGIEIPRNLDHIDLIEVAPGKASLKIYGGRIHAPRMQDLPYHHDDHLTGRMMDDVFDYNVNDLDTTTLLFNDLSKQIELRSAMSREYGIDLRSKSDAQVAEAVIKSEVGKLIGKKPKRPEIAAGTRYQYKIPDFIRFESDHLNDLLDDIEDSWFKVDGTGKIVMPSALADRKIPIGDCVYRLGIGGLHSSESKVSHLADDDHILVDRDVASYYPAIIINLGLYPKQLTTAFLKVYRSIVARRLEAKEKGEKHVADSLKITINGSFGKFGSKWSALYSPNLLIQTTITGQLSLLMLIEMLEEEGIPVVSGNTDGIVIRCPKRKHNYMGEVVERWERRTGFKTEETEYAALYSRDVNNYIAVKKDGSAKRKGAYAEPGLMKNPANVICVDAVIEHITKGASISKTIRECRDIRKFITVRTVNGGATKDGEYLGKAIRWYMSTATDSAIHYKKANAKGNHNKVPRSDGARPLMQLPERFPDDIDYGWYIREARSILRDIAYEEVI